jgi:hypothetical protein
VNADDFIYVNVGCNGMNSDMDVTEYTTFHDQLKANMLNLHTTAMTRGELNCVFAADDAFTLHKNMVKPFTGNAVHDKGIYNYCLSKVRSTVKNPFRILANQFPVFHTEINMMPKKLTI